MLRHKCVHRNLGKISQKQIESYAPAKITAPPQRYPKAFNANSLIKGRLTTVMKTAAALPAIFGLNLLVFLYLTRDVLPPLCQKFKNPGCEGGRGPQPGGSLPTEQVAAAERAGQGRAPAKGEQTHQGGFSRF